VRVSIVPHDVPRAVVTVMLLAACAGSLPSIVAWDHQGTSVPGVTAAPAVHAIVAPHSVEPQLPGQPLGECCVTCCEEWHRYFSRTLTSSCPLVATAGDVQGTGNDVESIGSPRQRSHGASPASSLCCCERVCGFVCAPLCVCASVCVWLYGRDHRRDSVYALRRACVQPSAADRRRLRSLRDRAARSRR
jgi:hypothetical protein